MGNNKVVYSRNKLLHMMDQNSGEVDELMAIFVRMVPEMLDEMLSHAENEDWKAVSNLAHKLKSSMRLWEIDSLDEEVVFIETYGLQEIRVEELKAKITHLRKHLSEVVEEMKLELSKKDA